MENKEPQQNMADVSARKAASAREMRKIAQWLKTVHFRKALFGVSQKDVWKKIGELNDMYTRAIVAERARYDAMLEQMREQYLSAVEEENAGDGQAKE